MRNRSSMEKDSRDMNIRSLDSGFQTFLPHGPVRQGRTGFTLIEVLLAVTLTAMICAVLYGVIFGTLVTHARISGYNDAQVVADRIADMIAEDLMAIYVADYDGNTPFKFKSNRDIGLEADRLTMVTCTETKMPSLEEDDVGISGFNEVAYVAVPSTTKEGYLSLYRREALLDDDTSEGGRFALLHDQVEEFDIRFVAGGEEVEWDTAGEEWEYSRENGLPRVVLISLVVSIGDPDTEEDLQDKNHISRFRRQQVYRVIAMPPGMNEDMSKLAVLEPKNPRAKKSDGGAGGTGQPGGGGLPGSGGGGSSSPPGGLNPLLRALNQGGRAPAPPAGGNPLLKLIQRHKMGR